MSTKQPGYFSNLM